MSTTAWERRKALSDQLRGAWDAQRDGCPWELAFDRAKAATVARLRAEADIVQSMTWDEFQRLQGWRDAPAAP